MGRTLFSSTNFQQNAVTGDKIQDGSIALADLNSEVQAILDNASVQYVFIDQTTIAYNLPNATSTSTLLIIKRIDNTSLITIINPMNGQMINGETSFNLYGNESISLKANNGNWYLV